MLREAPRFGVLLDEEAQRPLGRLVAAAQEPAVLDHQARRHALEPFLFEQRHRLIRRALVGVHELAEGIELLPERDEPPVEIAAVLGEIRRGSEFGGPSAVRLGRVPERRVRHPRDLTVGVRCLLVCAQPFEGFGAPEGRDVAEVRWEALLPALQPGERQGEEVVPGRIARRREAVEVVVRVPRERRQDLEEVFVRREGTGGLAAVGQGRPAGRARDDEECDATHGRAE